MGDNSAAANAKAASPEWMTDHKIARAMFDAPDADIVLKCTRLLSELPAEFAKPNDGIPFRVHRSRLAAVSALFETMMEDATSQGDDSESESTPEKEDPNLKQEAKESESAEGTLPSVYMQEHWLTVALLLGHVHNKPEVLKQLSTASFTTQLSFYEAANKYFFHSAILLSSMFLQLAAPSLGIKDCLKVYSRASMFDDEKLATAVLPKAAKVPLQTLSFEILSKLPTTSLMRLIRMNSNHIRYHLHSISTTGAYKHEVAKTVLADVGEIKKLLGPAVDANATDG